MNNFDVFKSQVVVSKSYPFEKIDFDSSFLLFDDNLMTDGKASEALLSFVEKFPYKLGLKGGEALKSFKSLPKNLDLILKKWPQPMSRSQSLVVLGGGSLGDFGGFVASILKRGVSLIQIPSTWLAAMDSAHGGKNGLNYEGSKNQIGTFYPAKKVLIIRELLESAPTELKDQAFGELVKMGLVGDSKFFKDLMMEKREASDFMWRFLPLCIEDKYNVILRDPYETKGVREILNFGHSFGHALEAQYGWPHGDAVLQGVFFSLEWSRHRKMISTPLTEQIVKTLSEKFDRAPAPKLKWFKRASSKAMLKWLQADKKIDLDGNLSFVFIRNIGKPKIEKITLIELLEEAKRQNWVK